MANNKVAIERQINDNIKMMFEAESIDELTSAYVRTMDALTNLHLVLIKEHIKYGGENNG